VAARVDGPARRVIPGRGGAQRNSSAGSADQRARSSDVLVAYQSQPASPMLERGFYEAVGH
jgi:hypothetical protein